MPTWRLTADRRRIDYERLVDEVQTLADTVEGLELTLVDRRAFETSPDGRDFRDFAPVADLTHDNVEALEIVTEELLLEFGWLVDVSRSGDTED